MKSILFLALVECSAKAVVHQEHFPTARKMCMEKSVTSIASAHVETSFDEVNKSSAVWPGVSVDTTMDVDVDVRDKAETVSSDQAPAPSPAHEPTYEAAEGDVIEDDDTMELSPSSPGVLSKTTAILDWDDTICPSTYLASLGVRVDETGVLSPSLKAQLAKLEEAVIDIVKEALRFGAVVIITNAEAGWVELSGRKFLPGVVRFLEDNDIKIVSARTTFECDFPDAPSSWKVAAFSQEVTQMFPDEDELNVLVLGDSMSERDAAHALGSRMPNSKVKTVKFVERPSIDQLMRQVQLVAQSLPDLASYSSSFDVDLVVSASS